MERLRARLAGLKADAVVITDIRNIRYLTGFTGSSAYLIINAGKCWFLTDSRYATQAAAEVGRPFRVKVCRNKKWTEVASDIVGALGVKVLGFEGDNLNYNSFLRLKKAFSGVRMKSTTGVVAGLRSCKDAGEAERIRASARVLDKGFAEAMNVIRAGVREREAGFAIEMAFMKAGAEKLAFETIIASGERGALPHGKASGKKIGRGEFVVVDMGVVLNGYNSDETRTFCTGRPTAEQKRVYQTVADAQARAIDRLRAGVKASTVDKAARAHIRKAGYGKYFGHGTGHGVGLEIHEAPFIGPASKDVLEEGMVVTIEPGIYLPEWGGVRIEDMALIEKDGCEIITNTTRELVRL